jgi:hypothetical protein
MRLKFLNSLLKYSAMNVEWPNYVAKIYTAAQDGVGCVPKKSFELAAQDQKIWSWFCGEVLDALQDDDPKEGFTAHMVIWHKWIDGKSDGTVRVDLSEPISDLVRKVQSVRSLDDSTASQFVLLQMVLTDRNQMP